MQLEAELGGKGKPNHAMHNQLAFQKTNLKNISLLNLSSDQIELDTDLRNLPMTTSGYHGSPSLGMKKQKLAYQRLSGQMEQSTTPQAAPGGTGGLSSGD